MKNIRPTYRSDKTFRDRLCRLNTNSDANLCILIWNIYFQCWSKKFSKYLMWIDSVLLFGKLWQPLSTVSTVVVLSLQLVNIFRNCPLTWLAFIFFFFLSPIKHVAVCHFVVCNSHYDQCTESYTAKSQVQRGLSAFLNAFFFFLFDTHFCVMSALCLLIEKLCFPQCPLSVA